MKLIASTNFALLCAAALCGAADIAPVVEHRTGEYALCYLSFGADEVEIDAVLGLRDGTAQSAAVIGVRHPFLESDAKLSGGALRGRLFDAHPVHQHGQKVDFTIDVKVGEGGALSGSFSGRYNEEGWNSWAAKLQKIELEEIEGEVTGRLVTAAQLAAEQAIAKGADWPHWEGPSQNCIAAPSGRAMIDDLKGARLVWKSEAPTPGAPGPSKDIPRTMGNAPLLPYCGGGATPVIGEDKVFLRYTQPSGDVYDKELYKKYLELGYNEAGLARGRKLLSVSADDAVVAFDARSGELLWRTTFPDAGLNFQGHKIAQNNLSALYHDGRVFAIGSTLRFYALDAKTGEMLWQSSLGAKHDEMEQERAEGLAKGKFLGGAYGNRAWGFVPVAAGGLIVCNDKAGGLVAFEPATGEQRWRAEKCAFHNSSPLVWKAGGKDQLIIASYDGIHCLDATTGEGRWTLEKQAGRYQLTVSEGLLAFQDLSVGDPKTGKGTVCAVYRLGEGEPQRIWETAWKFPDKGEVAKDQFSNYVRPMIHKGVLYLSGRLWTDCFDAATGKRLARIEGEGGVSNAGHLMMAGGRLFLNRDGKHAKTQLAMYTADPKDFRILGEPEVWSPPHPNTTSYGPYMRFPIVDGRMFIRGNDAIYCYDLRKRD